MFTHVKYLHICTNLTTNYFQEINNKTAAFGKTKLFVSQKVFRCDNYLEIIGQIILIETLHHRSTFNKWGFRKLRCYTFIRDVIDTDISANISYRRYIGICD